MSFYHQNVLFIADVLNNKVIRQLSDYKHFETNLLQLLNEKTNHIGFASIENSEESIIHSINKDIEDLHHYFASNYKITNKNDVYCEISKNDVYSKKMMTSKIISQDIQCHVCTKRFTSTENLKFHMIKHKLSLKYKN